MFPAPLPQHHAGLVPRAFLPWTRPEHRSCCLTPHTQDSTPGLSSSVKPLLLPARIRAFSSAWHCWGSRNPHPLRGKQESSPPAQQGQTSPGRHVRHREQRWENTDPLRSRGVTHVGMKHDIWNIQPPSPPTSLRSDGLDPDSPPLAPAPEGRPSSCILLFQSAQTEAERQLSLDVGRQKICNKAVFKKHCLKSDISLCFTLAL